MSLATAKPSAVCVLLMDEASGNAIDDVGSHDFAEVGGTLDAASGLFGGARDFELADTEGLELADHTDFRIDDTAYTMWSWINIESLSAADACVINKGNGPSDDHSYFVTLRHLTGKVEFAVFDAANFGGGSTATSTGTLQAGWNLVIVKHDPTADVIGVSLNGAAFDTDAHSTGIYSGAESIKIGWDGFGDDYDGLMDETGFIKGYAFSDADASELWNSGAGVAFADWDAGGGGGFRSRIAGGLVVVAP